MLCSLYQVHKLINVLLLRCWYMMRSYPITLITKSFYAPFNSVVYGIGIYMMKYRIILY